VARAAWILVSQLFRWRQELCGRGRAAPGFSAVAVVPEVAATPSTAIEVEFATGARLRITGPVDASTIEAMVTALAKAKR
jgi:transposase